MKIGIAINRGTRAFTLVEVCVGTCVIAVMMLTLFTGFRQSFGVVQSNRENLRATQILQEKMELIRLYSWNQITNPGYIPTNFSITFDPTVTNGTGINFTGTVTLTNAPITETYSNDMRMVTINVIWSSSGESHSRAMTTFISRYGLQNYIY